MSAKKDNRQKVVSPSSLRAVLLIVVAGIMAHGLLLLTDYSLWDGIWEAHHLRKSPQNYDLMLQSWRDGGRGYVTVYFEPLRGLAHPEIVAKWIGFASWVVSAVALYYFLSAIPELGERTSLAVSLISVTLPFYDVLGDVNSLVYSLPVAQFWLGFAALQRSLASTSALRRAIWTIAAVVLLFSSLMLNSNLVFFYAVFCVWFWLSLIRCQGFAAKRSFALRYAGLAFLPLAFWFLVRTFYPTTGSHQGWYNEPTLDLGRIAAIYASAWSMITGEITQFVESPTLIAVSLLASIGCLVWLSRREKASAEDAASLQQSLAVFFVGIALALCAVFPYAAVGQELASFGWWSRNAILMNVPVALCLSGLFLAFRKLFFTKHGAAFWLPVMFVVLVGAGLNNTNYLRSQALGAKQQAIARALSAHLRPEGSVSVVQLRDYFSIPWTINFYPPMIWSYIAAGDSALPRTLVVDTAGYAPDQFDKSPTGEIVRVVPTVNINRDALEMLIKGTLTDYVFAGVPRDGRQLLAVVIPGAKGTDGVQLGLEYLRVKYFDPASMPQLLESMLECRIQDIGPVGA